MRGRVSWKYSNVSDSTPVVVYYPGRDTANVKGCIELSRYTTARLRRERMRSAARLREIWWREFPRRLMWQNPDRLPH